MNELPKRGGARPGAGPKRKPAAEKRISFAVMIKPATKSKLDQLASERGISLGVLVDQLASKEGISREQAEGS